MRNILLLICSVILGIPLLVLAFLAVQQSVSHAASVPANLEIDTSKILGPFPTNWASFSQGGEEPPPMLHQTISQMKVLHPRYIRLDHIYDYYSIVRRSGSTYEYDFSSLDKTIDDILAMGAKPFFSLSYMPPQLTASGSVIDTPQDWNEWQHLVSATIEHYSGSTQRNISNVYYEVWNEPELPQFGGWKLSGNKDYRLLYRYASLGAQQARDTRPFSFGGPAIGSYYPDWIREFVTYVEQNNLRLDFFSWHRYHKEASRFSEDARLTRSILARTSHSSIPLILSEWGIESNNLSINNSALAAAFTVSVISQFGPEIAQAYAFEIKDGPPPQGGMWGLLTHEQASPPLKPKPKYDAFEAISKLRGEQLEVYGSGTYVSAMASRDQQTYRVLVSNYDLSEKNTEQVPVKLTHLPPGTYTITYTYVLTKESTSVERQVIDGSFSQAFPMLPNSLLLIELSPVAKKTIFLPGKSTQPGDFALNLQTSGPIKFQSPEFHLPPVGGIHLDIQPFWESSDKQTFTILDAPYRSANATSKRLFLSKHKRADGNMLIFGIIGDTQEVGIELPINNWKKNSWYHLDLIWDSQSVQGAINGTIVRHEKIPSAIDSGDLLTIYPIAAAIDNLSIVQGKTATIRLFDGHMEK